MRTQRGIAPRFFAGAAISNAIDADGIGKAVIYGTGAEEVLEGTSGSFNFAGVIKTVDFEATITRTNSLVNQGARNVAEGDVLGLVNDEFVPVKVSGAVAYKDFLQLDDNGAFKKLEFADPAAPTGAEVMKICGRVIGAGIDKAGVVIAHVWVRK